MPWAATRSATESAARSAFAQYATKSSSSGSPGGCEKPGGSPRAATAAPVDQTQTPGASTANPSDHSAGSLRRRRSSSVDLAPTDTCRSPTNQVR